MQSFDTVIVSDIHLGADNCQAEQFLEFLGRLRTHTLILAGDVFDCPKFTRLNDLHVEILSMLRSMASGYRVVWVAGNHDPTPGWCRGLMGLGTVEEYVMKAGSRRYLVSHGHRWDSSLHWPGLLIQAADGLYRVAQRLDRSHSLARWLKRKSKRFCRVVGSMRLGAVNEARNRGLDGVVLGHSHLADDCRIEGVHYVNSGSWTERPCTFVGVRGERVSVFQWCSVRSEEPVAACGLPLVVPVSELA
jgi:UDP-2,3-diacylglucosamine pyrophosphatase LpxH